MNDNDGCLASIFKCLLCMLPIFIVLSICIGVKNTLILIGIIIVGVIIWKFVMNWIADGTLSIIEFLKDIFK